MYAEHARQIVSHVLLSSIMTVHVVDELSKDFKNGRVVDFKLLIYPFRDGVSGIAVDVLASCNEVLLYACQCCMLPYIQIDDLVGNNCHALEGQTLSTSPREALNHPALSLLLEASDLFLDKVDHDVVIDVLEVVEALLDAGGVVTRSLDMIAEELSSADTLPFKVLRESLEVFLSVCSWCTEQEYTTNLLLLYLLKHELEGVIRS